MGDSAIDILYVITDLKLGGVPLHLYRLVDAVRTRGLSAAVVCLTDPGPVAEMLREVGVEVVDCGGRGGFDFRVIGRLARVIRERRPDLVHAMLFHANLAARWAAPRAGFATERLLCEIQTVEVERRWHLWADRWTYEGCRLTIGNSPSVVDHLASAARIPRERLRLIRGGIDPKSVTEAEPIDPATIGVPTGAPIVVWTGRLDPVKGLDVLIRAFGPIAERRGAHLLLAGEGALRDALRRWIEEATLTRRVHLLGSRSDVPSLLKRADLFAFPSRTEGLPNALMEAMAAGCPIVTTDVPGCRDLVTQDRTGLVVPYGDVAALSAAMDRLLQDRSRATALGRAAAEEVTEKWQLSVMLDAYVALYHEVVARRGA